jgi:hypothetical protein
MIGVVLLLAVAAAGCGGDSGDGKDSPASDALASQAPGSTRAPEASPTVATPIPVELVTTSTDRIRIPAIGTDVPLQSYVVGTDGVMPDPRPNVGIYDFRNFPQYGGKPGEGNTIIAGNIGQAQDGPFGSIANFRRLKAGDPISFTLNGREFTYTVALGCSVDRSELVPVLNRTNVPVLTIMQNVSSGATTYFVAEDQPNTAPRTCPVGTALP